MQTKIYKNTTKKPILVREVGEEIAPGETLSLTGEHLPPIVLENYPGVVDLEAEAAKEPASE